MAFSVFKNCYQVHTTRGLRQALHELRTEWQINRQHRRGKKMARPYQSQKKLRLNVACGEKVKTDWLNVDLHPSADLQLDLRERIPLTSGSCQIIYSEHFLEHLAYPSEATFFLQECRRLLESGGRLHLGVPDTEWPLKAYAGPDKQGYFKIAKERWHPPCHTKLEHINIHFREGGQHRYAYDWETLHYLLEIVGFIEIQRRDFISELDSADRALGTLYVQALNP